MQVRPFAVLLLAVAIPVGWPAVYPLSPNTPRHSIESECRCAAGGECWCPAGACPCMDHGALLVDPVEHEDD